MTKGLSLEWSNGKPRATVRVDEVPALSAPPAPALHDQLAPGSPPTPGRKFAKGNRGRQLRAERERQAKRRAHGIATLAPSTAPSWLRPYVELGAPYIASLRSLLAGKEELYELAGDVADAHVVYRGMLSIAVQATDTKERLALLAEARGWLREHKSGLATLSALAGGMRLPEPDAHAQLFAAGAEEDNRG